MDYWNRLKASSYYKWRKELDSQTMAVLTSSDLVELSEHNTDGYFHRVRLTDEFGRMSMQWEQEKRIPIEWISKGDSFGIWLAMGVLES